MERKRKNIPERLTVSAITAVQMVFFVFLWMIAAYAKDNTASTMRMEKTEGTVKVLSSSGKEVALLKKMKLKSGNKINTEEESYAWITLDDAKLLKMDAVSEAGVRKKGKQLEDDEVLNIRTSSMTVGIRGTSGWVKIVDNRTVKVNVLEGNIKVCATDPLTGQAKTDHVSTGETAVCVVYDENASGGVERCDILKENYTAKDVNGFVLTEVIQDKTLCEEIYKQGGVDLRSVTEEDVKARLQEEQEEMGRKMEEIGRILNTQGKHVSTEMVWAEAVVEKPAELIKPDNQENPKKPTKPKDKETSVMPEKSGDNGILDIPTTPQLIEPKPAAPAQQPPALQPIPSTPQPPAPALIDSGTTTGGLLNWSLYDDGKLIITGNGEIPAGYFSGWYYSIKDDIKTVVIGKGVTGIGNSAFEGYCSLTSVSIPNSVTSIGNYAFSDCSRLTSVNIPSSVTSIGEGPFDGCDSLTDVYFDGTRAEWDSKPWNTGGKTLFDESKVTVHCTDDQPTVSGDESG